MWSVSLGEVSVSMGSLLCSRSQAQSSEEARRQHFLWKKYRRGPGAGIRDSLVGKVTPKARFQGPVELSTGKSGRTESGASALGPGGGERRTGSVGRAARISSGWRGGVLGRADWQELRPERSAGAGLEEPPLHGSGELGLCSKAKQSVGGALFFRRGASFVLVSAERVLSLAARAGASFLLWSKGLSCRGVRAQRLLRTGLASHAVGA